VVKLNWRKYTKGTKTVGVERRGRGAVRGGGGVSRTAKTRLRNGLTRNSLHDCVWRDERRADVGEEFPHTKMTRKAILGRWHVLNKDG